MISYVEIKIKSKVSEHQRVRRNEEDGDDDEKEVPCIFHLSVIML